MQQTTCPLSEGDISACN